MALQKKIKLPPREPSGKGKKGSSPPPPKEEPNYYDLKLKAIDDLVTATPENSPKVPKAELRKYHAGPKVQISDWVKALLLKIWFAGVLCYFFVWGLSSYGMNQWDHLVILGLALGMITNLITNNIFRFIARKEGAYDRWMMFPGKSLWWLPADLIYGILLVVCVIMTYGTINRLFPGANGAPALGVEPILFGIFTTLWDLLFIGAKHLLQRILRDAKASARKA